MGAEQGRGETELVGRGRLHDAAVRRAQVPVRGDGQVAADLRGADRNEARVGAAVVRERMESDGRAVRDRDAPLEDEVGPRDEHPAAGDRLVPVADVERSALVAEAAEGVDGGLGSVAAREAAGERERHADRHAQEAAVAELDGVERPVPLVRDGGAAPEGVYRSFILQAKNNSRLFYCTG